MFHMYDKKIDKCDVTCSLPPPLSQTVTPSRTPSPHERDVLYERPLSATQKWMRSNTKQLMRPIN